MKAVRTKCKNHLRVYACACLCICRVASQWLDARYNQTQKHSIQWAALDSNLLSISVGRHVISYQRLAWSCATSHLKQWNHYCNSVQLYQLSDVAHLFSDTHLLSTTHHLRGILSALPSSTTVLLPTTRKEVHILAPSKVSKTCRLW